MAELNDKQMLFCKEYIIDLNATAAYIRAGYKARGNSAEVNAHKLLRNPKVSKEIQRLMNKRSKKVEYAAEDVLKDIKDIIVASKEYDPKTALKGLELYGKHLKLFTDRVELDGKLELPEIVIKKAEKPKK